MLSCEPFDEAPSYLGEPGGDEAKASCGPAGIWENIYRLDEANVGYKLISKPDHMLTIDWTLEGGWGAPKIEPFGNFSVHPGAKVRKPPHYCPPNAFFVTNCSLPVTRCSTTPKSCSRV